MCANFTTIVPPLRVSPESKRHLPIITRKEQSTMSQPARRLHRQTQGAPAVRLQLHTQESEAAVAARVQALLQKIHDRSAVVGIVGLGYVGLPFAVEKGKV